MVAYSFQRQFVPHICAGLGIAVPAGFETDRPLVPKRQTIRAVGKRRHARPGEALQLYHGMRTRQCFKIGHARCVEAGDIRLVFGKSECVAIAGKTRSPSCQSIYMANDLDAFARLDGFADWPALVAFWHEQHGPLREFTGVIVYWEPLS